jgi:hypothetical protein
MGKIVCRLKEVRINNEQGTCPINSKREDWNTY